MFNMIITFVTAFYAVKNSLRKEWTYVSKDMFSSVHKTYWFSVSYLIYLFQIVTELNYPQIQAYQALQRTNYYFNEPLML